MLITDDDTLVAQDEIGLSEPAFRRFAQAAGTLVTVRPAAPPESLEAVRAKIHGRTLSQAEIGAIITDLAHYRYSDMEIAAFLIGTASFITNPNFCKFEYFCEGPSTQRWRVLPVGQHNA